jgi:hypothetical protein
MGRGEGALEVQTDDGKATKVKILPMGIHLTTTMSPASVLMPYHKVNSSHDPVLLTKSGSINVEPLPALKGRLI